MPYEIVKKDDKFCVRQESNGKILGCHDTKEEAEIQIVSININEGTNKSFDTNLTMNVLDDNISVEGYLFRYSDSSNVEDRDLHRQYWSKDTYLMEETFPIKGMPIMFAHSDEDEWTKIGIGIVNFSKEDDVGLFIKGQLHKREKWKKIVKEAARKRGMKVSLKQLDELADNAYDNMKAVVENVPLQWSMGAYPPTYYADKSTGKIERAGLVEATLTPVPAEPFGTDVVVSFKSVLNTINGLKEHEAKEAVNGDKNNFKNIEKSENNRGLKMQTEDKFGLREEAQKVLDAFIAEKTKAIMSELSQKFGDDMEEDEEEMAEAAEKKAISIISKDTGFKNSSPENQKSIVSQILKENQNEIIKEAVHEYMGALQQDRENTQKSISSALEGFDAPEAPKSAGGFSVDEESKKSFGRFEVKEPEMSFQKFFKDVYYGRKPNYEHTQKTIESQKAQNPYVGTLGGFLVGQDMATQILDPLRAKAVTFQAGVTETRVNNIGIYSVPKMTSVPTAYRPGINQQVGESEAKFDTVSAFLRPLACRVVVPRQMLMQTGTNVEQKIKDEMIRSLRLQIDKEILEGVGTVTGSNTGAEIRGVKRVLLGSSLAATHAAALDTNGRIPTYDDFVNADTALAEQNVEIDDASTAWIMHPRDRGTMRRTVDANGNPLLYPSYAEKPYEDIIGYRVLTTTQIDKTQTVGTNSDNSDIYFGNWRYAEYIIGSDIEIILDDMTLADNLQVRFIAYLYSDLIIHYPEAFYIMRGVRAQA